MLFNTQAFILFFLPLALWLFYRGNRWINKENVLLSSSLVFYALFDVRFLLYLVPSAILNWAAAWSYFRFKYRFILIFGIAANLAILAFYKYFNFFVGAVTDIFGVASPTLSILVPLGISFITFEHISYLLDVRKGEASLYALPRYLTYISFFPHLVSGPIVRHYELMPQLVSINQTKADWKNISQGSVLFLIGLVKKVLIADQVAPLSNMLFAKASSATALTFAEALLAPFAFGVQIYYDFSGYTDMALGIALMFGIALPINFDVPYRSSSIREFWRKWHITLSRFLRDYVYIPLGGSRNGIIIQCAAIMTTMTLCGLWHGAGWMFILWGVWHGMLLVINVLWNRYVPFKLPSLLGWMLTFLCVIAGWILFRAENLQAVNAIAMGLQSVGQQDFSLPDIKKRDIYFVAIGLMASIIGPHSLDWVKRHFKPRPLYGFIAAVILVFILLEIGKGTANDFIYFQF